MYPVIEPAQLTAFAEKRYSDVTDETWESFFHSDNSEWLGHALLTHVLRHIPVRILEQQLNIDRDTLPADEFEERIRRRQDFSKALNTDNIQLKDSWLLLDPDRFCVLIQRQGLYKDPDIDDVLSYIARYKDELTDDHLRIIFKSSALKHCNVSTLTRYNLIEYHAYVKNGLLANPTEYYDKIIGMVTSIRLQGAPFQFYHTALAAQGFYTEPLFLEKVFTRYTAGKETTGLCYDLLHAVMPHLPSDRILQFYTETMDTLSLLHKATLTPAEIVQVMKAGDPADYADRLEEYQSEGRTNAEADVETILYRRYERKPAELILGFGLIFNRMQQLVNIPAIQTLMRLDSRWFPLLLAAAERGLATHEFIPKLAIPDPEAHIDQLYAAYPETLKKQQSFAIALDFIKSGYIHKTPRVASYLNAFVNVDFLIKGPTPALMEHPAKYWIGAAASLILGTASGAHPYVFSKYEDELKGKLCIQAAVTAQVQQPLSLFDTLRLLMVLNRFEGTQIKNWIRGTPNDKIPQVYTIDGASVKVTADRAPYYKVLGPSLAHSWFSTCDGLASLIHDRTGRHEMTLQTFLKQNFPDQFITEAPTMPNDNFEL